MLLPKRLVPRLADIPVDELVAEGVRGLIVDFDNTLVAYGAHDLEPAVAAWIARARDAGLAIVLLSNNTTGRVRRFSQALGVESIDWALKPLPHGFRRAIKMLGLPPQSVLVIGDQLFTDILGARLAGVDCILVEPMARHDWLGTRMLRSLERLVLPHRRGP